MPTPPLLLLLHLALAWPAAARPAAPQVRRAIDLHMHVAATPEAVDRAVRIMDAAGVAVGVNLSGGTVTQSGGEPSQFERTKALFDARAPGRFVLYMNLDYGGFDDADFPARAARQIEEGYRLGAAGLKEYKRLGLTLKDGAGRLIAIDDLKLDPVWAACGRLGMPVSIHVADPRAFWLPLDPANERWEELKDHPDWWFGDPEKHPPREALHAARNRVIARHPGTTFVCVHFANDPEEIDVVAGWLERYPNMLVDVAARVPELGRHPPGAVRALFTRYRDRILFGTDFMVYDRLILGSGGDGPPPTDQDARDFFAGHWRWFETEDVGFAHMTPIQGDWTIDAIGLDADSCSLIYRENARRLLARSLPAPEIRVRRAAEDPGLDPASPAWSAAEPVTLDQQSRDGLVRPELATEVRVLAGARHLLLRYDCPFTTLTVFDPPLATERLGLWERDVVEAFIAAGEAEPSRYLEFEVAPNGERLDVAVDLPHKEFAFDSGFTSNVAVDADAGRWVAVMRIPFQAFGVAAPAAGTVWRANLYRCDRAQDAALALRPALAGSFHVPERFATMRFVE